MSALRHLVILLAVLAASWLAPARAEAHAGHGAATETRAATATWLTDPETVVPAQAAHCAGTCRADGACVDPPLPAEPPAVVPSGAVRQPDRVEPQSLAAEACLRPPRA